MAMNELQNVLESLVSGRPEIQVEGDVSRKALGCIERMLDFVATHPSAMPKPQHRGFVPNIGAA
jgi:quinolinate synthase